MAIINTLGKKALEKTSSTLSNFAKGAFNAGMAEAPGIAYGYSALKGLSGKFSSSTTSSMGGSTSTTSNGVTAKESRSLIAVNMLMLREMKQTNLGIQKLNRMIEAQTAIALRSNMFAEERNRESALFNEKLLNALKGLSLGGAGGTTTKNDGGGLLSGIADGIGTLLKVLGVGAGGALALRYAAPGVARSLARSFRPSTRSLPSTPSSRLPSSGTQLLGRNGQVIKSLPNSSVSSAASRTPKMPAGAGFFSRLFGGLGLLLYPSSVGAGTLDEYYKKRQKNNPMAGIEDVNIPSDYNQQASYLAKVIQAESGGRSNAQASTSSAFGLGQFVKGTFQSLAANAPKDSVLYGKSFEDYKKSEELQIAALKALTDQNRARLVKSGLPTDDASLYLAHFLGAGAALKVLQSNDSIDLRSVLPASYFTANPAVFGNLKTVGDLKAWAARKMSGPVGEKAIAAAAMAGGGGRGRPPVGSQSAATGPGVPGITTRSSSVASVQQTGSGTAVDKFLQAIPVYDKKADENSKKLLGQTTKTAEATTSNNIATYGVVKPTARTTKVVKTPYEIANEKFIRDFGKVTEKVYRREFDQIAQNIFGKDYKRGMTVAQGAGKGVVGTSAGKLLGISKTANKIFGEDYGPVFAQFGMDYMEEGLRGVGQVLFAQGAGAQGIDTRGLTGAILGNFAGGNKKAAKEQLLYGLLGIPTGPQSLSMFLGGPMSPFPSLRGVSSPQDLVGRIAMNAAQGTQEMLFGGPPGSGQGGGLFGSLLGRGGGGTVVGGTSTATPGFGGPRVDMFGFSEESLTTQNDILTATTTGNNIFATVGTSIVNTLGTLGSGILGGIKWLGGTLGNILGSLFQGLGSLFGGGGGGNFLSTALDYGGKALNWIDDTFLNGFGKQAINFGAEALGFATPFSTTAMASAASAAAAGTASASQIAFLNASSGFATGGTAAVSSTAAASSTFGAQFAAAAPYLAVALVAFSLLSGGESTPKLERNIIVLGNNDIGAKFDGNNIKMRPDKELYKSVQPLLDSLLNVTFTAVKNIQMKTQTQPPMLAIGMRYTHKDKKIMMKLYNPDEKIPQDPKWKKYYGVLDQSFNGPTVAAQMVRDIQAYYSEGKDENALTAITEATNEITATSFSDLAGGKFAGLSSLNETTAPVSAQEAELARMLRDTMVNKEKVVDEGDSSYSQLYNPATGKYENKMFSGQIGFDSQGRAIIDVNANNRLDLEDIQRSQSLQERSAVEAYMNNYNQYNSDSQINYNEAVRASLVAAYRESMVDIYASEG